MTMRQSLARLLMNPLASRYFSLQQMSSSSRSGSDDSQVVISSNGSTIVCWHPEQAFPYECSKPLPEPEKRADESVLRAPFTDALDAPLKGIDRYKHLFVRRSEKQVRAELMRLTHTNKHIWFPHKGIKYRKKNPPRDREFL